MTTSPLYNLAVLISGIAVSIRRLNDFVTVDVFQVRCLVGRGD